MAIVQAVCNVFKRELLKGTHDLDGGATYKIALYTSSATLGAATANYAATSNEVGSGGGYTTGGNTLTSPTVTMSTTVSYVDFADTSWTSASFTANGAFIYQSTGDVSSGDNAFLVLAFGGDFTATSGTFTIQFPTAGGGSELLRLT
jgi:hypothetical protein